MQEERKLEKYITCSVREPWNDLVAVRDKYVKEAEGAGKGLRIIFHLPKERVARQLFVEHKDLKNGRRSLKSFKDYFSKKEHYLIYFPIYGYLQKEEKTLENKGQNSEEERPQSSLF